MTLTTALFGCGGDDRAATTTTTTTTGQSISADERLAVQLKASAERRQLERQRAERASDRRERARRAAEKQAEADAKEAEAAAATPSTGGGHGDGGTLLSDADRASFDDLERRLGGSSGIAVTRAGSGGTVTTAGSLQSGVAWSTMKTGVAAATFAREEPSAATRSLLVRAITASDNAAAEQLWSALGSPEQAGQAVTAQLRAAGDDQTQVQTRRVRAGFTAFGQSEWGLGPQARFTAGLACTAAGKGVLDLMRQTIAAQRWGLGSAGVPAAIKGGWGPGSGGGYLVRQMGILTVDGRQVAVTIANLPGDGVFESGTRNLTQIASWAVQHVDAADAGKTVAC